MIEPLVHGYSSENTLRKVIVNVIQQRRDDKGNSNPALFNKQLLPGLLVDSADYHPSKELFPSGVALGK